METIVFIILQIFFRNARSFEYWGIFNNYSHSRPQSSSLLRMTDGEKSSGEPWTKLFRYLLLVETKKARLIGQSATR